MIRSSRGGGPHSQPGQVPPLPGLRTSAALAITEGALAPLTSPLPVPATNTSHPIPSFSFLSLDGSDTRPARSLEPPAHNLPPSIRTSREARRGRERAPPIPAGFEFFSRESQKMRKKRKGSGVFSFTSRSSLEARPIRRLVPPLSFRRLVVRWRRSNTPTPRGRSSTPESLHNLSLTPNPPYQRSKISSIHPFGSLFEETAVRWGLGEAFFCHGEIEVVRAWIILGCRAAADINTWWGGWYLVRHWDGIVTFGGIIHF
jgi:hypothetical protein